MTIKKDDPPLGLYIHIPFCRARCGYCDFVTFTGKEDRIDQYVEDLCKEIQMTSSPAVAGAQTPEGRLGMPVSRWGGGPMDPRQGHSGMTAKTIFFGGGTPSLLEPRHVSQILDAVRTHFTLRPDAEMTLEANPESITPDKA